MAICLRSAGQRSVAEARLREYVLRAARRELRRRRAQGGAVYADPEDLADQAATAAVKAISADIEGYLGDTRFTTWACKYVMFALSAVVGSQFWQTRSWSADQHRWQELPTRFGAGPLDSDNWSRVVRDIQLMVDEGLTTTQRAVFTAVAFGELPAEAQTTGLGPSRDAIYQALFQARRKVAERLAGGRMDMMASSDSHPADLSSWLRGLLAAEPGDTGCDLAFAILDRYAEAQLTGRDPRRRFPGVAIHLMSCPACGQDYMGLLEESRRLEPSTQAATGAASRGGGRATVSAAGASDPP